MPTLETSWNTEAQVLGYENEKEMLFDLYHSHNFSLSQIAKILGHSSFNVRRRLLMIVGLPLKTRGGPNNRLGRRILRELTDDELFKGSPRAIAEEFGCHLATVFAEKRLREKEREEVTK